MKLTSLGFLLLVFSACVLNGNAQNKSKLGWIDNILVNINVGKIDKEGGHYMLYNDQNKAIAVTEKTIECGWQTNKRIELRGNLIWSGAGNENWRADKIKVQVLFIDDQTKVDVLETATLTKGVPVPCHPGTTGKIVFTYLQNDGYSYGPRPETLTNTLRVYGY